MPSSHELGEEVTSTIISFPAATHSTHDFSRAYLQNGENSSLCKTVTRITLAKYIEHSMSDIVGTQEIHNGSQYLNALGGAKIPLAHFSIQQPCEVGILPRFNS